VKLQIGFRRARTKRSYDLIVQGKIVAPRTSPASAIGVRAKENPFIPRGIWGYTKLAAKLTIFFQGCSLEGRNLLKQLVVAEHERDSTMIRH
jgi:hypothetical protein